MSTDTGTAPQTGAGRNGNGFNHHANHFVRELFTRHPSNPILTAEDWPYAANSVFNPGATRLASGLTYRVLPLSDEQKRAALAAHAHTRGFDLSEDVASYLLTHARRDMGSLMSALDAIDRYSLENRRPVTVPLLKQAMQG